MENNPLSEDEVKEFVNGLLNLFGPIVTKIDGQKLPKRLKKKDLKNIRECFNYLIQAGNAKSKLDSQTLPKDFKTKQQMLFVETIFANLFGIPGDNPTKVFVDEGDPKVLYEYLLKSKSKAEKFQNTIHAVYYKIGKLNRMPQLEKFQQSLGMDTFISHAQSAERFNKHVKYLLRTRKNFSKRIVERHVNIFKDVSGHLETIIIILYGLHLIIKDKYKPFKEIRNNNFIGNMVNELKRSEMFSPLISAYNPHIRNAIQHTTYQIDPVEKKVEFIDRKYNKTMTFSEFVNSVKDTGILCMMLTRIEQELNYLKFVEYQKYRETLFKN